MGVVGVGYFGRFHASKYAALEGSELVALVDIDPARARAAAETYGGSAFPDLDSMLDHVDAVSVATTTSTHYDVARRCLERGVHVLVEKPITSTLEEADALIDLAESRGLVLQVGHQERFFAAQVGLPEMAGVPIEIHCERKGPFTGRSADTSVVLDLMIHDIDLAQSLVRSDVTGVIGLGTPSVTDHPDEADVSLYYANGVVVRLIASRASETRHRATRIVQTDATIEIDFLTRTCRHSERGEIEPRLPAVNGSEEGRRALINDNLGQELASFLDVLATGGRPMVTGDDGRRALDTALTIDAHLNQVLTRGKVVGFDG
jgi:predicted dehydrogenase